MRVCERVCVCLHLYVLYTIPLCASMYVRYMYAILIPCKRATHAVLMRICYTNHMYVCVRVCVRRMYDVLFSCMRTGVCACAYACML